MTTDYKPSIAALQQVERELLPGPWDAGEDAADGEITSREGGKRIATVGRAPVAANTAGIAVLRNAAPVLLEIAAAALERQRAVDREDWDAITRANDRLRAALAKVRP